jgi:hypothetical protein
VGGVNKIILIVFLLLTWVNKQKIFMNNKSELNLSKDPFGYIHHPIEDEWEGGESIMLNPNYVTGFADGESCFYIKFTPSKNKVGWIVQPVFCIELQLRDLALIKAVQKFFGVGRLLINNKKNTVSFSVQSVKELNKSVIPHFIKYSLLTQKRADFLLFKMAVELISNKEHLTIDGLRKIVALRASINKGLTPKLKESFPNIIPVPRPQVEDQEIKDPHWLAGFTDGEGCFLVRITNCSAYLSGSQVKLVFTLAQHSRDEKLVKSFVDYFGCGKYYKRLDGFACDFVVTKFSDLEKRIIPFYTNYSLQGMKSLDFQDFKRVSELMNEKAHLTPEGVEQIRVIKSGMNRGR